MPGVNEIYVIQQQKCPVLHPNSHPSLFIVDPSKIMTKNKLASQKQLLRLVLYIHFLCKFCYAWNYVLNKYLHESICFFFVLLYASCYVIKCRRRRRFNYHCLEYSLQLFLLREFCFFGVYTLNVYEMRNEEKKNIQNVVWKMHRTRYR